MTSYDFTQQGVHAAGGEANLCLVRCYLPTSRISENPYSGIVQLCVLRTCEAQVPPSTKDKNGATTTIRRRGLGSGRHHAARRRITRRNPRRSARRKPGPEHRAARAAARTRLPAVGEAGPQDCAGAELLGRAELDWDLWRGVECYVGEGEDRGRYLSIPCATT